METSHRNSGFPILALLLFGVLVGGIVGQQFPLVTSRPDGADLMTHPAVENEDRASGRVEARLWEDPFQAVLKHLAERNANERLSRKTVSINAPTSFKTTELDILALAVILSGSPYAEGSESRLRTRYAVLSGLGSTDHTPEDGRFIRYFHARLHGEAAKPTEIPYEWFFGSPNEKPNETQNQPEKKRRRAVLVLWLNDRDLDSGILNKLKKLQSAIDKTELKVVDFKVIGPPHSDMLKKMYAECDGNPSLAGKFEIYSPWATAGIRPEKPQCECLVIRTHPSDPVVVDALIEELERRGVDPTRHTVALVSEWDTFYGQELPKTFEGLWESAGGQAKDIKRFSYLRSLDGELARRPSGDRSEEGRSQEDRSATKFPSSGDRRDLERAEGRGQLDYARRLAERMVDINLAETRAGKKRIRAIGVLGTDVYDKLLLLQALRGHFPDVIFFTTDLDARLLHPGELSWTRNLVVASGFGLKLKESMQRYTPPFRESYQTAAFYSMLLALGDEAPRNLTPGIFEIGRNGAFDLTPPERQASLHPERLDGTDTLKQALILFVALLLAGLFLAVILGNVKRSIHNFILALREKGLHFAPVAGVMPVMATPLVRTRMTPHMLCCAVIAAGALALMMAVMLLLGLISLDSPFADVPVLGKGQKFVFPVTLALTSLFLFGEKKWFWIGAFVVVGIATVLGIWFHLGWVHNGYSYQLDEPISFTAGVSLWPTEALRVIVAAFCLYWLFRIRERVKETEERLGYEFRLVQTQSKTPDDKSLRMPVRRCLWRIFYPDDWSHSETVQDIWEQYRDLEANPYRAYRILLVATLFFLTVIALASFSGFPAAPFRGEFSYFVNKIVVALTSCLIVLLMASIIDVNNLSRSLINGFAGKSPRWPEELERRYAITRGETEPMNEWLKIKFIAKLTEVDGRIVIYPFLALFVMIISRLSFFDNWSFPLILGLVFILIATLTLISHYRVRLAAEHVRRLSLESLSERLIQHGERKEDGTAERIAEVIKRIEATQGGAFSPLRQNPLIAPILLPTGAYGLLTLIDYLALIP